MMTKEIAWWNNRKANFSNVQVHMRDPKTGDYYTTGTGLKGENKIFQVEYHNPTGSYFHPDSHIGSLGKVLAFIGLFPLHKVTTTIGKAELVVVKFGDACLTAFHDRTTTFSEAVKPALTTFRALRKDVPVLGLLYLRLHGTTFLNLNVYNTIWWLATAGAIVYALRKPKDMKAYLAQFEAAISVKGLDEHKVSKLDARHKFVFPLVDGSYSLSRILGMSRIGTDKDKCYDEKAKLIERAATKKKSK